MHTIRLLLGLSTRFIFFLLARFLSTRFPSFIERNIIMPPLWGVVKNNENDSLVYLRKSLRCCFSGTLYSIVLRYSVIIFDLIEGTIWGVRLQSTFTTYIYYCLNQLCGLCLLHG